VIDERDIREYVLYFLDLVRGDDDSASAVEVIVQQRIKELLSDKDIESRFVQH